MTHAPPTTENRDHPLLTEDPAWLLLTPPLMVFAALVMEAWLPSRHARQRESRKHDGVMKLRQMGHDGVVGFAGGYAARPQRTGSGGHLLHH